MKRPGLYKIGQINKCFSKKVFWFYCIYGSLMGLFIMFMVALTFEKNSVDD
jgi:magnesium-transporting ATPase (P-type)